MKIANSNVSMSSTHREYSYSQQTVASVESRVSEDLPSAILSLSQTGLSYKDALTEYEKQKEEEEKQKEQEKIAKQLQAMREEMRDNNDKNRFVMPEDEDFTIKMLRQMLALLRGEKVSDADKVSLMRKGEADKMQAMGPASTGICNGIKGEISATYVGGGSQRVVSDAVAGTWQRTTIASGFHMEAEITTFASKGIAHTEDGRSLDFNIELSMTRSFMEQTNFMSSELYYKKDPLVINVDSEVTSVSDKKFLFDLDGDGEEENISFAGQGSGFLAYDKNDDGIINDGTELFGTESGDGFADLSKYDNDSNGWIDENDEIYSRLRVWTKDDDGNDHLIDLKTADVGAIFLGSANTQFSLKDESHNLNAEVKKTGIYLKESSGAVGTVNHVDLVI